MSNDSTLSPYVSWESIVSGYDEAACLMCGRNKISEWASKSEKYCKALKMMMDGKSAKAVDIMEKVALDPKTSHIDQSCAIYQLLYFSQFASFDFAFDCDYVLYKKGHSYKEAIALSKEIQNSEAFPIEYHPSKKNFNKYKKKNRSLNRNHSINIDDIDFPALYVGLLPVHGDLCGTLKYHSSISPDKYGVCASLDSLIMASLEEYKRRVDNGFTYSYNKYNVDKAITSLISNNSSSYTSMIEANLAINDFLPYIQCTGSSKLFDYHTSSDTVYEASKRSIFFLKDQIALLIRASSMGNETAFLDLMSMTLGMTNDANLRWKSADYKKAQSNLKALLKYKSFEAYSSILTKSINSLDYVIDNLKEIEEAQEAYAKAERDREEAERQRRKAEKQQQVLAAIGGILQLGAQTYDFIQYQKSSTSTVSPSHHSSYGGSSTGGGIAQKIENPQYFQDTFNQIMQMSFNQVRQEEYNEYQLARQGYQQMGRDISLEEWRNLKGQAILDLKAQGVDIIADQRKEIEQMNKEFKDRIDTDRKDRLDQNRNSNNMKSGNNVTSSSTGSVTSSKKQSSTASNSSQPKSTSTQKSNDETGSVSQTQNDSHQQYKSGNLNVNSSDYTYKRGVTLYRKINGKWTTSNLNNKGLYSKDGNMYVNVGHTYFKVLKAMGTTNYQYMITIGAVAHYFN